LVVAEDSGVIIGEGSIIHAGSVVVSNMPDFTIACGHPAIIFSKRNEENYPQQKKQKSFFMRILFLTDNFIPETNAPATRTYEHCREWAKKGVKVTVITCAPNFPKGRVYDGYSNKIYSKEVVDGIIVIRVWSYISANEGTVKRILDYLSYMISSFIAGLFIKTDIIVATSPQFFTAISGRWLSFWKRKKWIMEVRDIWPESIKAVGAMKDSCLLRFFEFLECKMYKSAYKIVVVTDSFKNYLIDTHKIDSNKIGIVKNGVDLKKFESVEKNENLLLELGLIDKKIIGYIGTHGMAHALDFILRAAKRLEGTEYHFLLLGDGAQKKSLLKLKDNLKLSNVTMIDSVTKDKVKEYISILDIGLVNLKRSDTFLSVIPSKIFELAAMEIPILLGVEGESKKLVEFYNLGLTFEPENEKDFIMSLEKLSNKTDYNFKKLKTDFNRVNLATQMLDFISQ